MDGRSTPDMLRVLNLEDKFMFLHNASLVQETNLAILMNNTDEFFLVVVSIIIFFMQCGFAFLEAGSVRYKPFFKAHTHS